MTTENYTYTVRCKTCRSRFKVQLFESHDKNLFLVDKRDWYCETCKKAYADSQTQKLSQAHQSIGFPELTGTRKMIAWAEKIRAELINKVNYLKDNLRIEDEAEKAISAQAFQQFFDEWRLETAAKWWIDHRSLTVRDITRRVEELAKVIRQADG
jgi:hypothetical protein